MDNMDFSISSVEDGKCNEDISGMKAQLDNEDIQLLTPINETSTQIDHRDLQKYVEIGLSAKGQSSEGQNEFLESKEDRSFVCKTDKDSENNISLETSSENLETSDSRHLFAGTDAICCSSSDDELLDLLKKFGEKCESGDVSYLENPIFGLTFTTDENTSNSSFTTSFSCIDGKNESQTTECTFTGADGSTLQEDWNPWKSSDTFNRFDVDDLPSLPKQRLSKNRKSKELLSAMHFSTMFAYKPLKNEKIYSDEDADTVPLLGEALSNDFGENEPTERGVAGDFYNCFQKKDKTVRRKVKIKTLTTSQSDSLTARSLAQSVSVSAREIRRSLLQISKSLEQTLDVGDDSDRYETHCKCGEVKYFAPKTWLKELASFTYQTGNADTTPRLDTESMLKEVQQFFERNLEVADESLSWKEIKYRIVTSTYFSEEFSRSHGLLSNEELMKKYLKDFGCFTYAQRIQ